MNKLFFFGSVSTLGLVIGATTLLYLKRYKNNKVKELIDKKTTKITNEVFFFPDSEFPCSIMTKQLSVFPVENRKTCLNPACRKLHGRPNESPSSLLKFLAYLSNAKRSVDLCIFVFTQPAMANILKSIVNLGIRVRIMTDGSEDEATSNKMDEMRNAGIIIKSNKRHTGALMHHKFVIIDGELLLTGSFNWTNKAVISNYEAVLATSEKALVEPFKVEFEKLWNIFNIHPRTKGIFD